MAQIVKRRGKDLTLNWAIKTNGAETALAGRDLTLVRTSPCGHSVKMTWTSEGNKLIFHFRGRKQVECGSYKFTLWENLGKNGQSVVDCTDQLQLVESTELEQEGNADNLEVESVDLTSADVVLGAKGADGRGIVSMVQTLSSTASGGKNAVTVTYTDGTTAVFEFYNGAQGEDADIEGCEEAISSANDARDEALAQVEACKAELATLRNDYTTKYQALANDYAGVKASLTSAYNSELATLRSDYSDVKGALQTDYRTTKSSLSSDYTAKANALASRYAELQTALQTDYNDKLTTLNSQYTADVNAIKNRYDAEVTSAKANMETKLSQIQTACNNAIGAVNTKLVEYNSDHDTAVSDHSIANADHNTALSDHNIASTDHNTASTDHNTASADHATAVSDHSKVSGAEKVNAVLSGRTITVTDRQGVSKSVTVPEGGSGGSGVTSYNDLTDKPTIPTKTSQLTNDSGFATIGVDIATLRDDINGKVDKVEGKGLSTNDYTTADKNKVAQVEDLVLNIGQLSNLQTTEKSNLVGAINEIKKNGSVMIVNVTNVSETDGHILGTSDKSQAEISTYLNGGGRVCWVLTEYNILLNATRCDDDGVYGIDAIGGNEVALMTQENTTFSCDIHDFSASGLLWQNIRNKPISIVSTNINTLIAGNSTTETINTLHVELNTGNVVFIKSDFASVLLMPTSQGGSSCYAMFIYNDKHYKLNITPSNSYTITEIEYASKSYVDNKWQISDSKCGALSELTTTDKTSLVKAINEVNAKPSSGGSEPSEYIKSASVSGNTLTLTKKDNTTQTYTPSTPTWADIKPSDGVALADLASTLQTSISRADEIYNDYINAQNLI